MKLSRALALVTVVSALVFGGSGFALGYTSRPVKIVTTTAGPWDTLPTYADVCKKQPLSIPVLPVRYDDATDGVDYMHAWLAPLALYIGVPLGAGDCEGSLVLNYKSDHPCKSQSSQQDAGVRRCLQPDPSSPHDSMEVDHRALVRSAQKAPYAPLKTVLDAYADFLKQSLDNAQPTAIARACYGGAFVQILWRTSLLSANESFDLGGLYAPHHNAYSQGADNPRVCAHLA